jgi:hypothetical protein
MTIVAVLANWLVMPNLAFFSPNKRVEVRVEVYQELNTVTESLNDNLGLPAMLGADRTDCFLYLIEKVIARINGWKEKSLSMGGKEVLLKAIAQAMPVFAMTGFKIPKNVCKGITDAILQLWWVDDDDHRRMH